MEPLRPRVSKDDVLARYAEASLAADEHRKMMSSRGTWEGRFQEAARLIPWPQVRTWLDVGCGTARFFEHVIGARMATGLRRCVGVDATGNSLLVARAKPWPAQPHVEFVQTDIENLDGLAGGPFDLVTMVGVVYQCGLPPEVAVSRSLAQLAAPGALLVTTENVRFKGFIADPHGCYPDRAAFEQMLAPGARHPERLTVQYTNPLWGDRASDLPDESSGDYKELFFLASYGAA